MDIIILVLLVFVSAVLIYFILKFNSSSGSIEANDLMNFSNSLNSQIQDIRKEINSNSKDSRNEIETKLNIINKTAVGSSYIFESNVLGTGSHNTTTFILHSHQ